MDLNYSQSNWLDLLHPALFSINNSSSSALPGDMTPIQAETGRNPLLPIDTHKAMSRTQVDSTASVEEQVSEITAIHDAVREAITAARQRMKDLADKKRREIDERIKVGERVWLNLSGIELNRFNLRPCPKLNPKYFGPFEIIAQPGPLRFKLKLPADAGIHDTFHVARLKPYTDPALVRHGTRPLASEYRRNPDDISDEEQYEVEGILDHDTRYGKRWYLIHWKGYDEVTQSTWEKREALTTSAKKILADYEKKHPILKGELARKKRRKKT